MPQVWDIWCTVTPGSPPCSGLAPTWRCWWWSSSCPGPGSSLGTRAQGPTEATEEEEEHQEEEIENVGASSGNNDNLETLPPPPTASRGILRSLIRSLVINSLQLIIFVTICLVSLNAYQHETYEFSKLYEITANQIREFVTNEKRLEDIQTLKKIILGWYLCKIVCR